MNLMTFFMRSIEFQNLKVRPWQSLPATTFYWRDLEIINLNIKKTHLFLLMYLRLTPTTCISWLHNLHFSVHSFAISSTPQTVHLRVKYRWTVVSIISFLLFSLSQIIRENENLKNDWRTISADCPLVMFKLE